MISIIKEFNNQKGRFNRYKFWVYTLVMCLLIMLFSILLFVLWWFIWDGWLSVFLAKLWGLLIPILYLYVTFVSYIKRLHDLDKSWWMSLLLFVPLANIYLFVICGFFKWTNWKNQYWDNPLGNTNDKPNSTSEKKDDNSVEL